MAGIRTCSTNNEKVICCEVIRMGDIARPGTHPHAPHTLHAPLTHIHSRYHLPAVQVPDRPTTEERKAGRSRAQGPRRSGTLGWLFVVRRMRCRVGKRQVEIHPSISALAFLRVRLCGQKRQICMSPGESRRGESKCGGRSCSIGSDSAVFCLERVRSSQTEELSL